MSFPWLLNIYYRYLSWAFITLCSISFQKDNTDARVMLPYSPIKLMAAPNFLWA